MQAGKCFQRYFVLIVVVVVGCVCGGGGGGGSNYNFTKECSSCPIVYTYDTFLLFMSSSLGASYEFKYIEIGLFRFLMKTQITWWQTPNKSFFCTKSPSLTFKPQGKYLKTKTEESTQYQTPWLTLLSAVWPVPYTCAQSCHPRSGSHGLSCFVLIGTNQLGVAPSYGQEAVLLVNPLGAEENYFAPSWNRGTSYFVLVELQRLSVVRTLIMYPCCWILITWTFIKGTDIICRRTSKKNPTAWELFRPYSHSLA